MTALLIVLAIMTFGTVVAWGAWKRLSVQEHDVLHTHPKLMVALIVAVSMILSVMTVVFDKVYELAATVHSATSPSGEVAKRGQQQQIVVVADIEDVSIAAAACAQKNEGVDAIRACVVEQVETRHGTPPVLTLRTTTTRPGG